MEDALVVGELGLGRIRTRVVAFSGFLRKNQNEFKNSKCIGQPTDLGFFHAI